MREVRILLVGGLADNKFKSKEKELIDLLKLEDVNAAVTMVNFFEQKDLSIYESGHDFILAVGTNKLNSKLPIVNGMALLYAWMDRSKMLKDIYEIMGW